MFAVPMAVRLNRRTLALARAELADVGPATGPGETADREALRRLPWAGMLGEGRNAGGGNTALSLPAIVGVLAGILLAICFFGLLGTLFSGKMTPREVTLQREWCGWGAVLLGGVAAACYVLESRRRNQPDAAPDLLAALFPGSAVLQSGRMHVSLLACGAGEEVGMLLAVQNRYDTPSTLRMVVKNGVAQALIEMELAGSEAAMLVGSTLAARDGDGVTRFTIEATSTAGSGGTLVRRREHRAWATAGRSSLLAGGMALGGHFSITSEGRAGVWAFAGSKGRVCVASSEASEGLFAPAWTRVGVWSPGEPLPVEFAASMLQRFVEGEQVDG
jgi:hypothetical protein